MTLKIHPDLIQGSDPWLDVRRGIVTASVVGQLITERRLTAVDYDCPECPGTVGNPCQSKTKFGAALKTMHTERADVARATGATALEVADSDRASSLTRILAGERINGWTDPTYVSDDMLRGIEDEPRARDKYADHTGCKVTEVGFITEDKWGFTIGYSPDGLVGDVGLIECKSRRSGKHIETVVAGKPPAENMAQLQTALLVSGREWIDYVSYAGGMRLWVHRVFPEERWFDAIVAAAAAFEKSVADVIARYKTGTSGFPLTERTIEMEMVI